jgi:hypothetical protein
MSGRITRRQFSKLLGVPLGGMVAAWAIPQAAKPQETVPRPEPIETRWTEAQKREALKAAEDLGKQSEVIRKFTVSTEIEPAFVFRALSMPRLRKTPDRRSRATV